MNEAPVPLLRVRNLVKQFPGVKALKGVSLEVGRGEVLAVIGENGAGKSTLMKILAGVQAADSGTVALDGDVVAIRSVRDATERGIALIHQELNLADNLDVGANIFLGREPRKWGGLVIDHKTIARESQQYLAQVGLKVSPHLLVNRLSIGHQQLVEIAKALSIDARILIMDEPTSSLSQGEAEDLYRVIETLRDRGVSVIYISHRLGEVKRVADRVVVLRDGENAGELQRDEIHHDAMVRLMVGRDLERRHRTVVESDAAPILTVQGLCTRAFPRSPVSFSLRPGEIVGVAGLVGAGRTEILQAIFGAVPAVSGEIAIGTEVFRPEKPLDAMNAGIALVPEDRKQQGLILQTGIRENVLLASLPWAQRFGFVDRVQAQKLSAEAIARLNIKTPNDLQMVQLLSGGNQQKVVLGKWLGIAPRILLLDEPTRGVDVGAKGEIYRIMEKLVAEGVAILFVSSEMEEVLNMADRVLVVHEGAITGELRHGECTEERIMQCATGQTAA